MKKRITGKAMPHAPGIARATGALNGKNRQGGIGGHPEKIFRPVQDNPDTAPFRPLENRLPLRLPLSPGLSVTARKAASRMAGHPFHDLPFPAFPAIGNLSGKPLPVPALARHGSPGTS
ncbi:hypothetical protein [Oxalobacter paraformigenes]|uniref:hypothetical protein n=1 Tax=Oxalobacter paraformigenes TaxID=556268 RepID=UPI0002FACE1D|nr:hypothetical protein [Oxalobacter paraformigenes]